MMVDAAENGEAKWCKIPGFFSCRKKPVRLRFQSPDIMMLQILITLSLVLPQQKNPKFVMPSHLIRRHHHFGRQKQLRLSGIQLPKNFFHIWHQPSQ